MIGYLFAYLLPAPPQWRAETPFSRWRKRTPKERIKPVYQPARDGSNLDYFGQG